MRNNRAKVSRIMAFLLIFTLIGAMLPVNSLTASAATASVSLSSLGAKGTVDFGSKTKSGTWWKMHLNGKEAFCINLGYTCHSGNVYEAQESHKWDQDTGGEKYGYYAKIIRWYVIDRKRSQKAFVMAQALIWSIAEGRNSKSQLKDVIEQVKKNINISPGKTVDQLYSTIFEPSGNWTAELTFWQKTGNSKSYQRLLTVDAERIPTTEYAPEVISDNDYYRQRITVLKKDEDGNGLGGIQFTLNAHDIDSLYSFSVSDRDGVEKGTADADNDTEFSLTGYTRDSGRIAFRMTYRLATKDYYYYSDADLAKMTDEEKKEAKKYLTDELEIEEGEDFASDMTKASAMEMMAAEMEKIKNGVSNDYTLTEDNTGDNKHLVVDPEYAKGVKITLGRDNSWDRNDDGEWPDSLEEIPSEFAGAYITGVTNRYKKATIKVVKIDKYSKDKKAHGEAELDGAVFQLYEDEACTKKASVFRENGDEDMAGEYTVRNGALETDYLRSGYTYYLKEILPPKGYTLSNDVLKVTVDASDVTAEYTKDLATEEYGNQPILGKVAVQKYYNEGQAGILNYEKNTTFQVYLTEKGSYDACDEYERSLIKTDSKGYGVSGDLYYGAYTVHQIDSGDVDAVKVDDFPVDVSENGQVYTYPLANTVFKAYLRILKKDGNTEKQVLKAGTTYQIYRVDGENEELVEQTYSDGNQNKKISQFITDESGEIMTVKELRSGTYRIYETDSASGLHITKKYIEVVINSESDNYESFTDEDGYTHVVVTVTYTNTETCGKLTLYKTGEMLTGYQDGKFIYEDRSLKGAVFEIYAAEDILTQDNQGTHWFDKDELVATVTTGKDVVFAKEIKDITKSEMDEDGTATIHLPLGKYHVREKKTLYGYILPEQGWDVEFTWENSEDEYVLDASEATDPNGVLQVENLTAGTEVSLRKTDAVSGQAVSGAEFGVYNEHDIYNVDGEKIVEAGTCLGRITTDSEGSAVFSEKLPLMSEGYEAGSAGTATGAAISGAVASGASVSGAAVSEDGNVYASLNSGDYYLQEISAPKSYYLSDKKYPVHLEYQDQDTAVVKTAVDAVNTRTTTTVSKTSVTNSGELTGCGLQIADADGNVIVMWVSGKTDSVKWNEKLGEMGYQNITAEFDEKGSLKISGLFRDTHYTLTETRPADGFVTADSIVFSLMEGENGSTRVVLADGAEMSVESDDVVRMVDDTTKVEISKTEMTGSDEVPGCKLEIREKDTDRAVESWTSTKEKHLVEQKLIVGKTYVLTETRPADGYATADRIEFTIRDSGEVQGVTMKDETTKIRLIKLADDSGQGLRGAKFEVYDSKGRKVLRFTSKEEGYDITGRLAAGETYTFKEIEAPKGYRLAKEVKYKVKDTGEIQKVSVTDRKIPSHKNHIPQTGAATPLLISVLFLFVFGSGRLVTFRRKRVRR